MKAAGKWLTVTAGVGAVWYVAQAILARMIGIVAFFVAAFQAQVEEMSNAAHKADDLSVETEPGLPRRLAADRAYRSSEEAQTLIDLREEINAP
ncbi:MAG: hypothetical protein QOH26_1337 [Actinomycetota bacterium]|nr:hypothetical protein [Actinomycetota bacterium]